MAQFRKRDVKQSDDVEALTRTLANPRAAAKALIKYDAERSLRSYAELAWQIIEPAQPLVVSKPFEAICEHLEAVHTGQIRNLLINVPPGFTKSTLVSVLFPSWEWGPKNRPDLRYLAWSYAFHLSKRDNNRCRTLIQHPLYQALWGSRFQIKKDTNAKHYYETTKAGFRFASSIGGISAGERGDRLLIDDPHNVKKAESDAERLSTTSWFTASLPSRVRNANTKPQTIGGKLVLPSSTIVIMQRLHLKDVSGIIIEHDLDFEHLLIEMEYEGAKHPRRQMKSWHGSSIGWQDWRSQPGELADPIRFNADAVAEQKKTMLLKEGNNAVAAQFRQWPFEGTGSYFKREYFKFCRPDEVPPAAKIDVRGWDFAGSEAAGADATRCVKMRLGNDGKIYILHAGGGRMSTGAFDDFIKKIAAQDGRGVRISIPKDPGQAGLHQVAYIVRELLQGYPVRSSPESGSKEKRAEPLSAQAEHGNVVLVYGDWNDEFVRELCEFPVGQHDDFVDAASRAYEALVEQVIAAPGYKARLYDATPD